MTDAELYKLIQNTKYIHTIHDVDYQIVHQDHICYLLFQESEDKTDWKVNFDFPCKIYRHGKLWVHHGYAKTYKAVKKEIMQKFLSEIKEDELPVISGWSYGASMAVLAAEDFFFNTGKEVDCVTFGGAKICYTPGTVRYLQTVAHITEYTQSNDFVTWVAPWCLRIHAKKVGEVCRIKKLINTPYYHCNYGKYIDN